MARRRKRRSRWNRHERRGLGVGEWALHRHHHFSFISIAQHIDPVSPAAGLYAHHDVSRRSGQLRRPLSDYNLRGFSQICGEHVPRRRGKPAVHNALQDVGRGVTGRPTRHDEYARLQRLEHRFRLLSHRSVLMHHVYLHGSMGEETEAMLQSLQSRVLIVPSWAPSHPAPDVLKRIMNSRLPPSPRYVFATDLREAAKIVIGQRATQLAAPPGHIVVRVAPGGGRYRVYVLGNRDEREMVVAMKGPFPNP